MAPGPPCRSREDSSGWGNPLGWRVRLDPAGRSQGAQCWLGWLRSKRHLGLGIRRVNGGTLGGSFVCGHVREFKKKFYWEFHCWCVCCSIGQSVWQQKLCAYFPHQNIHNIIFCLLLQCTAFHEPRVWGHRQLSQGEVIMFPGEVTTLLEGLQSTIHKTFTLLQTFWWCQFYVYISGLQKKRIPLPSDN